MTDEVIHLDTEFMRRLWSIAFLREKYKSTESQTYKGEFLCHWESMWLHLRGLMGEGAVEKLTGWPIDEEPTVRWGDKGWDFVHPVTGWRIDAKFVGEHRFNLIYPKNDSSKIKCDAMILCCPPQGVIVPSRILSKQDIKKYVPIDIVVRGWISKKEFIAYNESFGLRDFHGDRGKKLWCPPNVLHGMNSLIEMRG